MVNKSASFVLASLRGSTYRKGTPCLLASLRPRWTAFLTILHVSPVLTIEVTAMQ